MNRDVIDFNEQVYRTALELAEARGASRDTLQGLAVIYELCGEAHEDIDVLEGVQELLTGGSEVRSNVAEVLAAMQGQNYKLIIDSNGRVVGRRVSQEGRIISSYEYKTVTVLHSGHIRLEVFNGYLVPDKQVSLPTTRLLTNYFNSYTAATKYVYSLWAVAYLMVLAQNILQYNLPTSVPFMDEEG